jgi:hypothetical protein
MSHDTDKDFEYISWLTAHRLIDKHERTEFAMNHGRISPLAFGIEVFKAGVEYGRANPVLQPMDTAPKDGTIIDGYMKNNLARVENIYFASGYWIFEIANEEFATEELAGWTPIPQVNNE